MKMVYKTEQIEHLQVRDSSLAVQEMLTGYRSTPHPAATGVTPYEDLMNRQKTTKLDHQTKELQCVDTPLRQRKNIQFCQLKRRTNLNSHLIQEIHYFRKISDDSNFGQK